jgi:hypothetical protein
VDSSREQWSASDARLSSLTGIGGICWQRSPADVLLLLFLLLPLLLPVAYQMIATDKLRNTTREALTALRKQHSDPKAWLQTSSISFKRCSTQDAISSLEAGG